MKKWLAGVIGILGAVIAAGGFYMKNSTGVVVSVIGGADGPTSIFLAGKLGSGLGLGIIGVGLILIVAAALIWLKGKNQKKGER